MGRVGSGWIIASFRTSLFYKLLHVTVAVLINNGQGWELIVSHQMYVEYMHQLKKKYIAIPRELNI
jgi:hypothetical protein